MQLLTRFFLTIGLFALSVGRSEAGFVFGSDNVLLPNQANQLINIFAGPSTANEIAQGFNLYLFIDDGGSVVGGVDNNAPRITNVNLKPTGGLFGGISENQTITISEQKLFQVSIAPTTTASRPTITPNVLLAQVTLDTTGLTLGNWVLGLNGKSVTGIPGVSIPASDFAGAATTVTNGTLRINAVPEPSTLALICCASLAGMAIRRRNAKRRSRQ